MDHKSLCALLELPHEVRAELDAYGAERTWDVPEEVYRKLLVREEWEEGVRELQGYLGDDPAGMKVLWEQLNVICHDTYGEYVKREISEDVFVATMKFCTRFLLEHHATWNVYKYVWAWWFPRQMTLQEFRLGASLCVLFLSGNLSRRLEGCQADVRYLDADAGIAGISRRGFKDRCFSKTVSNRPD